MRAVVLGLCLLAAMPASAQPSPPLPPYQPPPSASPLAPLPDAAPTDDAATGEVRASSTRSANSSAADTRSNIAPALPAPAAQGDGVNDYLRAARAALQADQTGAAQEALERAESRALDRDIAPSANFQAIDEPLIARIRAARSALSVGNTPAALAAITRAID